MNIEPNASILKIQLTGDGVITESGQLVQKSAAEENKQGRENVTTLFQSLAEQSVRGTVRSLKLATSSPVQV